MEPSSDAVAFSLFALFHGFRLVREKSGRQKGRRSEVPAGQNRDFGAVTSDPEVQGHQGNRLSDPGAQEALRLLQPFRR